MGCILFVICHYCVLTTAVYQRFQEGQELLAVPMSLRGKKRPLCRENLKHKNKMRQGIVDNCCFGHLNYIPAKVAIHLIAALPLALRVPLAFGPCTWGLLPTLEKGLVEQKTCPEFIRTLWQ